MLRYLPIRMVHGRQILDSRGNPTIEVEVTVGEGIVGINGSTGRAMVPSGASTGKFEAKELRDEEKSKYRGLGVEKAVYNINHKLAEVILGENALDQQYIDSLLLEADGTEEKSNMGANAILGISIAVAKAAAAALRIPLYQYIGGCCCRQMPVPMMNILNGGKHADNNLDFQEFMIMPVGACSYSEGLRMCVEIYHTLREILREKNYGTGVGDEGGFAPDISDAREALGLIMEGIQKAGYQPDKDVSIGIDAAASELYDREKRVYCFSGESRGKGKEILRNREEIIRYYKELTEEFPICSIEDGLWEEDWEGWKELTRKLGAQVQLVGDDLFVTNRKRLIYGMENQTGNAVLVKVNQIGTLTEALNTIDTAKKAGYGIIISHRSGETEDPFIADLAVASGAGQIKTGAPCRSERNAKYNQLLRIEEGLGHRGVYENPFKSEKTGKNS